MLWAKWFAADDALQVLLRQGHRETVRDVDGLQHLLSAKAKARPSAEALLTPAAAAAAPAFCAAHSGATRPELRRALGARMSAGLLGADGRFATHTAQVEV